MFRTIHIKLVGIFILLIVSLMAVTGSFMITSIVQLYLDEFEETMTAAFNDNGEFVGALRSAAATGDPAALKNVLRGYSGILGIDLAQRHFYVLDAKTGAYLAGSDDARGAAIDVTAPNIIKALSGGHGFQRQFAGRFMDCAVRFEEGGQAFIVYIRDEKRGLMEQTSEMLLIIVEALMIGLMISVLLALVLSKTMTVPIENLTKSAQLLAKGELTKSIPVHSGDEIGVLTNTFNDMAAILRSTMDAIGNERDKLGTLFLHMNDGVAAFGKNGAILHMNPAAEKMLDTSFSDTLTFDGLFSGVVSPEEISGGETAVKAVERNDRKLNMSFTTFGAPGAEGGIMALIYDVTEQVMLDRMRREFISSISHEMRTPLTNVRSYAETLTNPEDLDSDVIAKFSNVIVGEADRMTRIISDLLTLSKFDYGKMDMHFTTFGAYELLKSAFEAMRLEALHRGQKFSLDIPVSLPALRADRERLEQVIVNVLSNAIKYTPDLGEIQMKAEVKAGSLYVTVADSGIGIPQEETERVFERFYRVDKARSRASGGTGLGLSIAREIVDRHGGDISISSAPGKGTAVTITLPVITGGRHV